MKRMIALLALATLTWGLAGCGSSQEPKKDSENKGPQAPGTPPSGV